MKQWKVFVMFLFVFAGLAIGFETGRTSATEYRVPILMYHDLVSGGKFNDMMVTQARFRQDMQYLRENGYTPLLSKDLVNIETGAEEMPARPVMITFDDGYESNYTLAYPVLREMHMRATMSVIVSQIGKNRNFMTWPQLNGMYKSGLVDIGCHTYALHNLSNGGLLVRRGANGIQRMRGEKWAAYQQRVGRDMNLAETQFARHIPTLTVRYFSYPFGATDKWFGQQIRLHHIQVTVTSKNKVASLRGGLYGLPRLRVTMDRSLRAILART